MISSDDLEIGLQPIDHGMRLDCAIGGVGAILLLVCRPPEDEQHRAKAVG